MFYFSLIVILFLATTLIQFELIESIWDKFKHSFAFFTLYILFSLSYEKQTIFSKSLLLIIYGILIECIQYFIPNRYFSFLDVVADIVGIFIGIVIYNKMYRKIKLNFFYSSYLKTF